MKIVLLVMTATAMATMPVVAADEPAEQLRAWNSVRFRAPVPCSLACPYWLDSLNADIDDNDREDIAFESCGESDGTEDMLGAVPGSPLGRGVSYDEVVVGPAPSGARIMVFEIYPEVDWDGWICTIDGRPLWYGVPLVPNMPCRGPLWDLHPFPTGCAERLVVPVEADTRYVLRAFNWSDPAPLDARYCFTDTSLCGTGEVEGQFESLPCGIACRVDASPCASGGQTYDSLAVPAGSSGVTLEVRPRGDWDILLCGGDGGEVAVAANILGEPCDNQLGPANPIPVGCRERLSVPLDPDETYEIRAYNVADVYPAPYVVRFS